MKKSNYTIISLAIGFGLLAGCNLFSKEDNDELSEQELQIEELRTAMQPFRNFEAALSAGYSIAIPDAPMECMKHPTLGAMGFHYGNGDLIPDSDLSVTEPEVLIYEPQADGTVEFVGVEYVIPFAVHAEDQSPPILFGREFTQSERFQVWKLHAWVGRENPSGMHVDWNLNVSCQHEDKWQ